MSFIGNETVFSICVSILSILISILGVYKLDTWFIELVDYKKI